MKNRLGIALFIISMPLFIIGIILPFFFESPKITYSLSSQEYMIRTSGLPKSFAKPMLLILSVLLTSGLILFFYTEKKAKNLHSEKDAIKLIKACQIWNLVFYSTIAIYLFRMPFSVIALTRIDDPTFADIVHSELFGSLGGIMCFSGLYLWFYDFILYYRKTLKDKISEYHEKFSKLDE